ncbi:MAG: rhomboid family intramembrane serine protease [Clostridia bacterium]|jgi:rhomboid protease GluP|nr:rhomboid family intramembrane serine protease [Clostridia bacterium]
MKKFDYKKFLTVTNILMLIIVLFYIFDRYLPLPKNYTGFTWASKDITAVDYLLGNCGGLLTNYLGVGKVLNYNSSQVYRYVTQMFLHGHLFHLIGNLVGLYFIGHYTEKRFGWWLTCIIFFTVGITEAFITDPLYLAMAPSKAEELSKSVSVGASGGIFGLAGASLAALFFDIKSFKQIDKPTLIVSIIYGVLTTYLVSFGWTTVCHNVSLILGLTVGVIIILPFYLLKKGKFSLANNSTIQNDNDKNSSL